VVAPATTRDCCPGRAWAHSSMSLSRRPSCILPFLFLAAALTGQAEPAPASLLDAPLAAWRRQLLELSFDAVSAMPTVPHLKNRCRNQEEVVQVCLQLGQELLAERYIRQIADWRRGPCEADLAIHLLERGAGELAEPFLAAARQSLEKAGEDMQPWRRDRLRAKLARAELLQGREVEAKASLAGIDPVQVAEFEVELAKRSDEASFGAQLKALDRVFEAGNFDAVRSALQVSVALYERYHGKPEQQDAFAERALTGYPKLPQLARLEVLVQLVEAALRHDDPTAAKRLLPKGDALVAGSNWLPDDEFPWRGRLAGLWGRAGANDQAQKAIAAALAKFDEERERMPDIYRSRCLRALAAASQHAGDTKGALRLSKSAAEEGVVNPNSKPRAEDLAGLCLMMAQEGIEPDAALLARLQTIRKGLSQPW